MHHQRPHCLPHRSSHGNVLRFHLRDQLPISLLCTKLRRQEPRHSSLDLTQRRSGAPRLQSYEEIRSLAFRDAYSSSRDRSQWAEAYIYDGQERIAFNDVSNEPTRSLIPMVQPRQLQKYSTKTFTWRPRKTQKRRRAVSLLSSLPIDQGATTIKKTRSVEGPERWEALLPGEKLHKDIVRDPTSQT